MLSVKITHHLHCDKSVINHHFFCQEICSYSSFILITELLIHILVHQRCLPNPVETKKRTFKPAIGKEKVELTSSVILYDSKFCTKKHYMKNLGHNKIYIPFMKQTIFLRIYTPHTSFPIWKAHKTLQENKRLNFWTFCF